MEAGVRYSLVFTTHPISFEIYKSLSAGDRTHGDAVAKFWFVAPSLHDLDDRGESSDDVSATVWIYTITVPSELFVYTRTRWLD